MYLKALKAGFSCGCLLYCCYTTEHLNACTLIFVAKVDKRIFKVTPSRLFLTFVGEPYPRVDAVGCVSSAQQSKKQQHQCQIHSPYALSHPY